MKLESFSNVREAPQMNFQLKAIRCWWAPTHDAPLIIKLWTSLPYAQLARDQVNAVIKIACINNKLVIGTIRMGGRGGRGRVEGDGEGKREDEG